MARNPDTKIILIGDDGEADANVYMRIMREYPGRVEAALIHNVLDKELPENFVTHPEAIIYRDFEEAAFDLHAKGLITRAQMEAVAREVGDLK